MGPLTSSGRVELALGACATLASRGQQLPLTIIGGGPNRKALERQAEQLGVGPLTRFVGDLPQEQVRHHLSRADLVLLTAHTEDSALAAMEGLISGVPIVACWDSGAAIDFVPESGAGRLSLPSPDAIAENILGLQADRDRLAIGRLVGESWRARLSPDNVAELCETWYRDALAR